MLSATLEQPPALVAITDYPDKTILDNLNNNVSRNRAHVSDKCTVHCVGFEWGKDAAPLLYVQPQHYRALDTDNTHLQNC